jgi:HAE1 family hydrophobic/amphiphilic exporter-1
VIIIPGLYYFFGTIAEGRTLIRNEEFDPLTEEYNYNDGDDQ